MCDTDGTRYGASRVWVRGRKWPGLAMSRSLGDTCVKGAVIPDPDVFIRQLSPKDRFLICAR